MSQVLARKWRPKAFAELVGQEHVVKALSNALDQKRLHHAYLFTGTRGVGKTTLARIIAKGLNCLEGISSTPCGVCAACREIDSGRFVDLLEIDAASNTQVDNMRELLDNALYAPTSARFKVYLIDEVHMLSRSAFNAMLKTLEEPPEHIKFILATTDPQKIPVTVLSRCLQFNLKQIPHQQIAAQLEKILGQEGIEHQRGALNLLARAAQGSMRDALSLLDQAIAHSGGVVGEAAVRDMLGTIDQTYLLDILQALYARDGAALLAQADRMSERSLSFEAALQDLASLLHRIALAQSVSTAIQDDDPAREQLLQLSAAFSPEDLQLYYQIAVQGRAEISLAPDEYAGFTMCLLRMLAFAPDGGEGEGQSAATASKPAAPPPRRSSAAPTAAANSAAEPVVAKPAPAQGPGDPADWPALAGALKLGGMARMLAQHCELTARDGARLELCVPEEHRHLLEKSYQDKLRSALEDHLGHPVKLVFNIGAPSGNSPAAIANRASELKQAKAIETIESDPFVRELVENFDARLIGDSIKPVQ